MNYDHDLWIDRNADCGGAHCGEWASQSTTDNTEYVIVDNPPAGTYNVKLSPHNGRAGTGVPYAMAVNVIRGDPTPSMTLTVDPPRAAFVVGKEFTITTTVETPSYMASAVRLLIPTFATGHHLLHTRTTRYDGVTMRFPETGHAARELTLGNIVPNGGRTVTWTFVAGGPFFGDVVIPFRAESENGGTVEVHVPIAGGGAQPSDLVVPTAWVDDVTLTPGQPFTLSAIVGNRGEAASEERAGVRFYESVDFAIAPGDRQTGYDEVDDLAPSAAAAVTIAQVAPGNAGKYYYGACVDTVLTEVDSTNNCSIGIGVRVRARTDPPADGERGVLEAFFDGTGGRRWRRQDAWLSSRPLSDWYGVTPDDAGRVAKLELRNNMLRGGITRELGNLTSLNVLDFGQNELRGSIPTEMSGLVDLTNLHLWDNDLTGHIPPELGRLDNLIELDLRNNGLTGRIPPELGRLGKLTHLSLDYNNLSGPVPAAIGELTNLSYLTMQDNDLSGPLPPSLSNLTDLLFVALHNNPGLCVMAEDLELRQWLIRYGQIVPICTDVGGNRAPVAVGTMPEQVLRVGDGGHVVDVGGYFEDPDGDALTYGASSSAPQVASVSAFGSRVTVTPVSAGTATVTVSATDRGGSNTPATQTFRVTVTARRADDRATLEAFYDATGGTGWTNRTNWKTSAPLGEWFGVTTDGAGRVTELDLRLNGLSGPIPAALEGLANLELLNLSGNRLTGAVPSWLGSMIRLRRLDLGGNALTGPIPGALASLVDLEVLYLPGNELTGPIPEWLGSMTRLRRLNLGGNAFSTGPIPGALASLVDLEILYLYDSNLTGPIPGWLGNLVRLEWLAVSRNSLSGEIPPALANLTSLKRLSLSGNQLTGPIPPRLAGLADLQYLDLQENRLTGRIPAWLGGLTNLRSLTLGGSGLRGPIPRELGNLTSLEVLYLWELGLTGPIPAWLGSLGNLRWLSLSRNGLTGAIPPELGNLADLERLWLYENPLTGTVPESLTQLSLDLFFIHDTGVCVPADAAFQAWVATIRDFRGDICTGPANRPPEPVGTLAPLTLEVGRSSVTVEVSSAFRDPDGDRLTYGARSSAPGVASVSASGSRVTVTPVSAGTATVTVTATDRGGSNTPAAQTFVVTVNRANRPPEAVGTLAPLTLEVGESSATVEVSGVFRDPDGDRLTYGARSSSPGVASVSVFGSRVTVTPVSAGTATVTVTATDRGGSNTPAAQTFVVTVNRANRPPEAVGTLAPLTLEVGRSSATMDASGAFRDPDGDRLTYGARSSSPGVASASASGSRVTVTPVSAGTATVTVTATDRGGSNTPAAQTFVVTVNRANRPPEAVGTLAPLTLEVGESAATVDASGAFRDPDGDRLTYGARSSAPGVASVSASGSRVTVTPVSAGTATVTVTATDRGGSNTPAAQTFVVTVNRANRPPEAVGTLAPLTLEVGKSSATVEVSGVFRDPDGDQLTYGARSSSPGVASVSVFGSRVTVTPVSTGTATVTVTATDTAGSDTTATRAFRVRVVRPFTDHPIVPGVTPVKAVHFTELRIRIDGVRAATGLGRYGWTDRVLTAGVTRVRLRHLLELRWALEAAYRAAGRPAPSWTDTTPTPGTTSIRAAHLMELRAAVAALE